MLSSIFFVSSGRAIERYQRPMKFYYDPFPYKLSQSLQLQIDGRTL